MAPIDNGTIGTSDSIATSYVRDTVSRPAGPRQSEMARIERRADFQSELLKQCSAVYRVWQRTIDIVVSVVALTLFALLLPIIALAIKIDSRGPIFFRQGRVGVNRRRRRVTLPDEQNRRKILQPGRPFRIYKLRSMVTDAEASGPQWAQKHDSRVTRVGRFLRHTRLDEVPQFINVLKGEMSVIGPRPERLFFVRKLAKGVPHYLDRLVVKPGITGLAQVRNGYDTDQASVQRKVDLDRQYIGKRSVRLDIAILLHTVLVVLKGEGAH